VPSRSVREAAVPAQGGGIDTYAREEACVDVMIICAGAAAGGRRGKRGGRRYG